VRVWYVNGNSKYDNSMEGSYKKVHLALSGFIRLGLLPYGCASGPCIIGNSSMNGNIMVCAMNCDKQID
jgi:hypothetical protein